jgi:hypothetical protein
MYTFLFNNAGNFQMGTYVMSFFETDKTIEDIPDILEFSRKRFSSTQIV